MSLWSFLKGKLGVLVIHLFLLFFTGMLLSAMQLDRSTIFYILTLYTVALLAGLALEYLPKRSYYSRLHRHLDTLDQKYLLCELIGEPPFEEGKLWYDALKRSAKSMNDRISEYERASREYREYIETWVHEIKTPIASGKLLIENNPSALTASIGEEIDRIDQFVEQALYYSRSSNVEKDYLIKRASLKELVNSVIRRHAKALIAAHVSFDLQGLDCTVYTDVKWTDFMLGQILSNAVKYRREDCRISVTGEQGENGVSLKIRDNGTGIPAQDLSRVFEKGFTGQNGRSYAKSTGMGLYLCKKLCVKLGLGLSVCSEEGRFTEVELRFPKRELLE